MNIVPQALNGIALALAVAFSAGAPGSRFSLGLVSWVEANGWGALAFQAHFGVARQSKT
jgi:hypothetical protein